MKNGRFSGKNVSNADRLTTAGSTSTCPKSGLIAPVRVSPRGSATLKSAPTDGDVALARANGFPATAGARVSLLLTYGNSSVCTDERIPTSPVRSPKRDTSAFASTVHGDQ